MSLFKKKAERDDRYYYASQWQLMYQKFRRHKLAMVSAAVLILFYLCALLGSFIAPQGTEQFSGEYVNCGPTPVHFSTRENGRAPSSMACSANAILRPT